MKTKIAIVCPIDIYPPIGGGQIRVINIIKFLLQNNFEVILISAGNLNYISSLEKTTGLLRKNIYLLNKKQQKLKSFIERNVDYAFNKKVSKIILKRNIDIVYSIFVWSADIFDLLPSTVLKILDTIDIQHIRYQQLLKENKVLAEKRYCTLEEEVFKLNKVDVLVAIQSNENHELSKMCPNKKVITIGFKPSIKKLDTQIDSNNILFVGNIYEPNILGIKKFININWKNIIDAVPEAKLLICGKVCDAIHKDVEGVRGIKLLNFVEDLESVYAQSKIVINPVELGTGQSVKTVEGMCYGKCIVSTEVGLRGIADIEQMPLGINISTVENMGPIIINLLNNHKRLNDCQQVVYEFAEKRFSEQNIYQEFLNTIEEWRKDKLNNIESKISFIDRIYNDIFVMLKNVVGSFK